MGLMTSASKFIGSLIGEPEMDTEGLIDRHSAAQASQFLPYRFYDDENELFVNYDGYGFCAEFVPLIGGDRQTIDVLKNLLSLQVPDECSIQILLHSSPKVGHVLNQWEFARRNQSPMYQALARRRVLHLGKGVWDSMAKSSRFMLRYHRCFISVSMKSTKGEEDRVINELNGFKEMVMSGLDQITAFSLLMKPPQLIALTRDLLNPTQNIQPTRSEYDEKVKINEQIIHPDTSFDVYRKRVKVFSTERADPSMGQDLVEDNWQERQMDMRCLETRYFPQEMGLGSAGALLGDFYSRAIRYNSPALTCLTIYYPKAEPAKAAAEAAFMRAKQVAEGPMGRFMPSMQMKAQDREYNQRQIVDGARPIHVAMFTMLTSRDGEGELAEKQARNVLTAAGFEVSRPDMYHLPAILNMMPMVSGTALGGDLKRMGRLKEQNSSILPHVAPIFGEFMGNSEPSMLLTGRLGQPMYFSNFSSMGTGNMNGVVIGASGSGKSFFINEMVTAHCGLGHRAFIIDDGYSFHIPCLLFGGKHYEFNLQSEFVLNPFDMIEPPEAFDEMASYSDYLNDRFETARAVFSQMAFGAKIPTREATGVIVSAIKKTWEKYGNKAGSNELAAEIKAMDKQLPEVNTDSMFEAMSPYINEGPYAPIFNGKNTLDMSSHMTVFEMSPLEQNKELRAIIVAALFSLLDSEVTKDRQSKDLIVLDEAWKVLGNDTLAETLEGWARRLRKYAGSMILGTQSVMELNATDSAKAILQSSEWTILLKSKGSALQPMADLNMFPSDHALRCAKDLKVSRGEYSEGLIMCEDWYSVVRLTVDPFTATLYSTNADEYAAMKELMDKGVSIERAVEAVAGI